MCRTQRCGLKRISDVNERLHSSVAVLCNPHYHHHPTTRPPRPSPKIKGQECVNEDTATRYRHICTPGFIPHPIPPSPTTTTHTNECVNVCMLVLMLSHRCCAPSGPLFHGDNSSRHKGFYDVWPESTWNVHLWLNGTWRWSPESSDSRRTAQQSRTVCKEMLSPCPESIKTREYCCCELVLKCRQHCSPGVLLLK